MVYVGNTDSSGVNVNDNNGNPNPNNGVVFARSLYPAIERGFSYLRDFIAGRFYPPAKHFSYLLQFFFQGNIFFLINDLYIKR